MVLPHSNRSHELVQEEKNRIRRNLEGFKPFTVSKSKADSAEFFRLIMAFGSVRSADSVSLSPLLIIAQPKPRSIEKDLKVRSSRLCAV